MVMGAGPFAAVLYCKPKKNLGGCWRAVFWQVLFEAQTDEISGEGVGRCLASCFRAVNDEKIINVIDYCREASCCHDGAHGCREATESLGGLSVPEGQACINIIRCVAGGLICPSEGKQVPLLVGGKKYSEDCDVWQ